MKFSNRETVNLVFRSKGVTKLGARTMKDREPVLIFDTVQTSTQEVTSATTYLQGGSGNARLLAFEGDKALTFTFSDALMSMEALSILAGADLIPARNKRLHGASPDARPVIATHTETFAVTTNNIGDYATGTTGAMDLDNNFANDTSISPAAHPRGGFYNVWLQERPYVGQNSSIYVTLLDKAGERSGAPVDIRLIPSGTSSVNFYQGAHDAPGRNLVLSVWGPGDAFVAFDKDGLPMSNAKWPTPTLASLTTTGSPYLGMSLLEANAFFDDHVGHYVSLMDANYTPSLTTPTTAPGSVQLLSSIGNWATGWGSVTSYARFITKTQPTVPATPPATLADEATWISDGCKSVYTDGTTPVDLTPDQPKNWAGEGYSYLLAPSGGIAEPKGHKEGSSIVYKVNVSVVLYQDIVRIDYYREWVHNAQQIDILPNKFAGYYYVEGDTLVKRQSDGMDLAARLIIPKLKIQTTLSITLTSTGDPAPLAFTGDAFPDYTYFDLTKKVQAVLQVLDADDNYDGATAASVVESDYRRYRFNEDMDGEYLWKDATLESHSNIDWSDIPGAGSDYDGDLRPPYDPQQFLDNPNEDFELTPDTDTSVPYPAS